MKTFKYSYPDGSLTYKVEFIQGHPLKSTHLGKTWAKRTQCTIRANEFVVAVNFVTKHHSDTDNIKYAYMNSFKPISGRVLGDARIDIIKQILEYAKNN